jgi:hypothetical protein
MDRRWWASVVASRRPILSDTKSLCNNAHIRLFVAISDVEQTRSSITSPGIDKSRLMKWSRLI